MELPPDSMVDPMEAALCFPPTETERLETDTYLEPNEELLDTFLYPTDFPRRDYQFNIARQCLSKNTLVCLPTGSGKTFIAAVVIMNFYRWYPKGIIIFIATTRALVQQQISACSNFTTIKKSDVGLLIGGVQKKEREEIWEKKRVIYATSQVIQNDLNKLKLDPTKVSLLILDEAHHTTKKHPYAMVVRKIAERNSHFRIVGLTATPGKNFEAVQQIIYNTMASHISYMDDSDQEIAQYQHKTEIEVINVSSDVDTVTLQDLLFQCIDGIAQPLFKDGTLQQVDARFLKKGAVFRAMNICSSTKRFKNLPRLGLLMTLTNISEKLDQYGISSLQTSLKKLESKKNSAEKAQLEKMPQFINLVKLCARSKNSKSPKLAQLSILLEDFFRNNPESRAIIFTNFREIAQEIGAHIKNIPNVRSNVFTGKAATESDEGLTEGTQQAIVNLFRRGKVNCIIATCVGEEGLDIGEVDLIVCYDTQTSPIRNVQRMGRTGRKREGRVVFLLGDGAEKERFESANKRRNFVRSMLTSGLSRFTLYRPTDKYPPLPDRLQCISLRCIPSVKEKLNHPEQKDEEDDWSIIRPRGKQQINEMEMVEMWSSSGRTIKYRKLSLFPPHSSVMRSAHTALITRSAESSILLSLTKECEDDIPEDVEDEILRLFGDHESDKEAEEPEPKIIPFAMNPQQEKEKGIFDDSSDNSDTGELFRKKSPNENQTPNGYQPPTSFISDSDSDIDQELISSLEEASGVTTPRGRPFMTNQSSMALNSYAYSSPQMAAADDEPRGFASLAMHEARGSAQPLYGQQPAQKPTVSFISESDDDDIRLPQEPPKKYQFLSDSSEYD